MWVSWVSWCPIGKVDARTVLDGVATMASGLFPPPLSLYAVGRKKNGNNNSNICDTPGRGRCDGPFVKVMVGGRGES